MARFGAVPCRQPPVMLIAQQRNASPRSGTVSHPGRRTLHGAHARGSENAALPVSSPIFWSLWAALLAQAGDEGLDALRVVFFMERDFPPRTALPIAPLAAWHAEENSSGRRRTHRDTAGAWCLRSWARMLPGTPRRTRENPPTPKRGAGSVVFVRAGRPVLPAAHPLCPTAEVCR